MSRGPSVTFISLKVGEGHVQALEAGDGSVVAGATVSTSHPEFVSASISPSGVASFVGIAPGASVIKFVLPSGDTYPEVINVENPSGTVSAGGSVGTVGGLAIVDL